MHYKEEQVYYAGTTTALPVPPPPNAPYNNNNNNNVNVGQVVYISSATPSNVNAAVAGEAPRRPRSVNQWADNICDWPNNLFPSCYCATCVCWGMWINAQMAQKINMMSFWSVFYVTVVYWFVSFVLQIVFPASGIMAWMMCLFSLIFSIVLRLKIYARDNINTPGGCFAECCIGLWCCPCSIAQMARHLYGYNKVLDGDGDPFRNDNYAHQV